MAQRKAVALIDAFEKQLDILRRDEIQRRDTSIRDTIKGYQANLQAARQRISELQQKTGLVSLEQFNEIATRLEDTRKNLSEARAVADRLDATQKALAAGLGMDPEARLYRLVSLRGFRFRQGPYRFCGSDRAGRGAVQIVWVAKSLFDSAAGETVGGPGPREGHGAARRSEP